MTSTSIHAWVRMSVWFLQLQIILPHQSLIFHHEDALFPLLVRHRMSSLWATLHTALATIINGLDGSSFSKD